MPGGDWRSLRPLNRPRTVPVGGDVAADGVQLLVSARNELLHHRLERLRVGVRALELLRRLAAEGLAAKAAPEPVGVRRLDEQRVADARRLGERLLDGSRVGGLRDVDLDRCGPVELLALALDEGERLLVGKGIEEPLAELVAVAGDRVHRRIVRREDRRRAADCVAELPKQGDVCGRVGSWIGRRHRHRMARAKAERARAMVDREHGYAHAAERADRRQAVDEGGVADHGRWVSAGAGVGRDAIAVQRRRATHRADSRNGACGYPRSMRILLAVAAIAATVVAAGLRVHVGAARCADDHVLGRRAVAGGVRAMDASVQSARRHAAEPEACVREAVHPDRSARSRRSRRMRSARRSTAARRRRS